MRNPKSNLFWLVTLLLAACNFRFVPTATPQLTATPLPPARLNVAYLESGNLYLWREGESTPNLITTNASPPIAFAPDGRHVAFTRGQERQSQTLWVVSDDGAFQQALVEIGDIPAQRSASAIILTLDWLDERALYLNTAQVYEWGRVNDNNLYRVDIGTETQAASAAPQLILPPNAGGAFAFSPDRQHIAVVYPGQYDAEDGRILILDPLGVEVRTALEFSAVSTASEIPFYPPLNWTADSSAVRVPIPDRDLIFDEAIAPPVQLWYLPINGESRIMGYVPASFAGLPRWSDRTGTILYGLHSDAAQVMYNLYLADADGANPQPYADGSLEILSARWIPGQERFVFARGTALMIGGRGIQPQPISNNFQHWILAGDSVIYTTAPTVMTDLRYTRLDDSHQSTLIASIADPLDFDAVLAP
jgi:hypothetical protein